MHDLSGTIVKSYELRERIGQGGFGAVYRAYQPLVKRDVAVKVILPGYANDANFIRRFETEAQLVARLEHLHIVPLYDYWREPDGAYLVMRWLRGSSLYQSIKRDGLWTLDVVARLVDQIASALAASHRGGVVHRDIKPANILLDEEGNAYLTDFGIAKDLTRADPAEPEALVGSLAYLSPEQVKKAPVSPQSDIYSFGIVLFEMLTGERPFEMGTYPQILKKHLHEAIPSVRIYRPDLPSHIDDVIQRATMKDPLDRYSDALMLAADFRQHVQNATPVVHVGASGFPPASYDYATTMPFAEPSVMLTVQDMPNPYKGLRPFEEADALDFYGREGLIERWKSRLATGERFLAIVGPSGSGKSSAAHAGLIPALRRGDLPGSEAWFVVDMAPGSTPFENLVAALMRVSLHATPDLIDNLRHSERGLLITSRMLAPHGGDLVLFIDQFEELFTQTAEGERTRFLENLRVAVTDSYSRMRVIVTLRADFYHRPLLYPAFGDLMRLYTDVVLPLSPDELERAIVAPAERAGLAVDTDLVATMVADVQRESGALPLLQYALTEAFERREYQRLTLTAYRDSGGVSGALSRRAETLFVHMDGVHQQITRQLLLRLVSPGNNAVDTRRRVRLSELMSVIDDQRKLNAVLESFINFRLLTVDHDPETREPTVEVAHEALIGGWRRLRCWLDEARDDLHLRRRLSEAASEWRAHDCDVSFLATGARLEQFTVLWLDNQVALSSHEIDFLRASGARHDALLASEQARQAREQELERRARNRLRGLVALFAGAAVVAFALSVIAFGQSQRADAQARIARSRELAVRSQERLVNQDLEAALLYALDALKTGDTIEARSSLLSGLQSAPYVETMITAHADRVRQIAASPDGDWLVSVSRDGQFSIWDNVNNWLELRLAVQSNSGVWSVAAHSDRLVTGHDDGTVTLWHASTGGPIGSPFSAHSGAVQSVAFSPDGRVIASGGEDGVVRLWDAETRQPVGEALIGHSDTVWSVVFSPDGTHLASASADSTIALWRVEDGQQISEPLEGHTNWVLSVAFGPDGQLLASGSADNSIRLWHLDSTTGEVAHVTSLDGHTNWVRGVAFSPDGTLLASASADGSVLIWNPETGGMLGEPLMGHEGEVWSVGFSPNGERLISAGTDGRLFVWNPSGAVPLATPLESNESPILALDYTRNGDSFLSISQDQTMTLWDAASHAPLDAPVYVPGVVTGTFSPDGDWIAFGRQDGRVQLWNRDTRTFRPDPFTAHNGLVLAVAYNPNGQSIASGGQDGAVRLWDIAAGAESATRMKGHSSGVRAVSFSPDGRIIASGDQQGALIFWDADSGAIVTRIDNAHEDQITSLAFSGDGRWLATGSYDETARLWDVATGLAIGQPLAGHGDWVFDVAFGTNAESLVTAGADGAIRLWDIKTGQPVGQPIVGHNGWAQVITLAPDGQTLISGGADGQIVAWEISVSAWRERACAILNPYERFTGRDAPAITRSAVCSVTSVENERAAS